MHIMYIMGRLWKEDEGQGMVEYGLILALIAIGCIAVLTALGPKVKNTFNKVNNSLS